MLSFERFTHFRMYLPTRYTWNGRNSKSQHTYIQILLLKLLHLRGYMLYRHRSVSLFFVTQCTGTQRNKSMFEHTTLFFCLLRLLLLRVCEYILGNQCKKDDSPRRFTKRSYTFYVLHTPFAHHISSGLAFVWSWCDFHISAHSINTQIFFLFVRLFFAVYRVYMSLFLLSMLCCQFFVLLLYFVAVRCIPFLIRRTNCSRLCIIRLHIVHW